MRKARRGRGLSTVPVDYDLANGKHGAQTSSFSVVVITLDFESNNGGSNPSGRFWHAVRPVRARYASCACEHKREQQ